MIKPVSKKANQRTAARRFQRWVSYIAFGSASGVEGEASKDYRADFDQFDWERLAEAQQFLSSLIRKCLFCYMSGCASWFFPNRCGLMLQTLGLGHAC